MSPCQLSQIHPSPQEKVTREIHVLIHTLVSELITHCNISRLSLLLWKQPLFKSLAQAPLWSTSFVFFHSFLLAKLPQNFLLHFIIFTWYLWFLVSFTSFTYVFSIHEKAPLYSYWRIGQFSLSLVYMYEQINRKIY